MNRRFDAIIIGAGQAGPPLASRLTAAGMTVALIERKLFGGTCVNTGCMPTKTLVASAYAAHLARRAADYGVEIAGGIGIDMAKVKARADTVSFNARTGVETMLKSMDLCTVFEGHARFEGPDSVSIGGETIRAERIFINVGGRAAVPDMPGVNEVPFLTNTSMLALETLPEHLVVIGGSYIGLEFAQMYRRFGSRVTIVEKGPRLIGREDEDVSAAVRAILEAEGITIRTGAECISFEPHDAGVSVGVDCHDGSPREIGSHALLAVGRTPNTQDLELDKAGVVMDARDFIQVDEQLRTNVPGIWAMGDCNGRGAFTHTAYNDFEIVAANLLDGDDRKLSDRITAYALYIDPPLGRVGMSEAEARKSGRPLLISTRPMTRVGRAVEKGETQGFMKAIADAETKQLLGAAILGVSGDEAVHGLIDLIYTKQPYTVIQRSVPIHPTVSELLPTLLGDLKPATV
ncbi:FAD-containing oxidoreductase [Sphingobium boeckii]|uniref:Pyruvate/2-oxoglutarate dehydrogenase complex dihydrolipoamide dehydrogenase (E3) component n=1 Tax=Sphingobium boeckii TaxID=1082345 RepID=A0A7W9AJ29_9SPHN|nr:FAD-containing oxidoreductase [Sphingobium boeckii]MBB5686560.1 pyruvate/2-oxoglutarate dehydrogenase complex dihydrolipoamide dehydrogenase (E3) component [Sphingobium boeckii]